VTRPGLVLAVAVALGGCLSVPDETPVQCKSNADCDTANGEVCEENVCWGNPPPGPFAALIAPPTKRKDELVSHELLIDALPQDGYFGDLMLAEPVTYSGQVVCPNECGDEMLAASIEVTRPSTFPGGPGFRQVFLTDPRTGTFQLVLPRVRPGEPDYSITIIPAGRSADDPFVMANLVPPLRTTLSLDTSQIGKTFDLGGESLPVILTGEIVDIAQNPATNYRVVALGRWDATSPITEVSTVDFIRESGGNTFTLRLSEGVQGKVEIVAQPIGTTQPTLRLPNVASDLSVSNLQLVIPSFGSAISSSIKVEGTGTGGGVSGVAGAHVTVTGALPVPGNSTIATFLVEGDTDDTGGVLLPLPGGDFAGSYKVSVVPQASSTFGVVFDQPIDPGANTIKLPDRVAIVGTVVDIEGRPLKGVQVTAIPSLRFQWSLGARPQTFVASIPSSTTVTPDTGEFVLHIDPSLVDTSLADPAFVFAYYDLIFTPNETTDAPSWTVFDVEVTRGAQSQVLLPPTVLPDAAHIHGRIVDPFGELIEGAELKLFRVVDPIVSAVACEGLTNAPASCPIPAVLLGRGVTDTAGVARLTLPR
jgi:hypothetical protein